VDNYLDESTLKTSLISNLLCYLKILEKKPKKVGLIDEIKKGAFYYSII